MILAVARWIHYQELPPHSVISTLERCGVARVQDVTDDGDFVETIGLAAIPAELNQAVTDPLWVHEVGRELSGDDLVVGTHGFTEITDKPQVVVKRGTTGDRFGVLKDLAAVRLQGRRNVEVRACIEWDRTDLPARFERTTAAVVRVVEDASAG